MRLSDCLEVIYYAKCEFASILWLICLYADLVKENAEVREALLEQDLEFAVVLEISSVLTE